MTTVTVVPTVELGNTPPRVKLDVTDTGSPNLFAATVTRLDPDGVWREVRTTDGNPLTLSTSGSNRVGLLYDYEAPFGTPVSYSTLQSPTVISSEVTVAETRVWLIHPGVPALSMPIEARAGSFEEEEWDVQQAVFRPMGRKYPVVQTDGQRKAPSSSVTVAIETLAALAALRALVDDASVLLLNIPASLNFGVATCYIAVGAIRNRRPSDIGSDPYRSVDLPYQVVDQPVGGSQSQRTLADLLVYSTLAALPVAYPTFSALLAGP